MVYSTKTTAIIEHIIYDEMDDHYGAAVSYTHLPCFRVVNAKGELAGAFAFGGEDVQAELLRADGVEVINGRVDLGKYGICVCGNLGKNSGRY